jgi:exopolysaccharide biosynthesis polyprenyl glycosylphosphotransferase
VSRQNRIQQDLWLQFFIFIFDIFGIALSFTLAFWLRFETNLIPVTKGLPFIPDYVRATIFTVLIWTTLFIYNDIYKIRGKDFSYNIAYRITKSAVIGTLLFMALVFIFRDLNLSRWFVLFGLVFGLIIINLSHWLFSSYIKELRKRGWSVLRTAVIGTDHMAKVIADKIQTHPESGYLFIGYISTSELSIGNDYLLGDIRSLDKIIQKHHIEKVIIACPLVSREIVFNLLIHSEKNIVDFSVAPDLLEIMINRIVVDDIYGIPLLNLKETPLRGWNLVLKFTFDRIASALGLLVLSPILMLIAILIKFDSRGPILYKQERIGADGKHFIIYKFRSMVEGAEKDTGPIWAKQDDPRKTRLGRIMRRCNIDELPQLFNVLRGDMSLVGPRPERPYFVKKFKEIIPLYMARHRVKSGITGWAQVNGFRGDTSIEDRTKHDLFYVENWSFLFDIKILLMTLWFRDNAY